MGETLTLDEGTWANENQVYKDHDVTWFSCDTAGNSCTPITKYQAGGATQHSSSRPPSRAD